MYLSDDQFEALWEDYHRTRSTSKTVSVSKEALFNLLRDHSTMYGELRPMGSYIQKREVKA